MFQTFISEHIDHFKCYKARCKSLQEVVFLQDQFEKKETKVLKPVMFCNSVKKNDEEINNSNTHLTCYRIRDVKGQIKFDQKEVAVENQFGSDTLTILNPKNLCVPSIKIE